MKGTVIVSARTVAFDSPGDGIISQTSQTVEFSSHTTGDADGLEITLDHREFTLIRLETPEGSWAVQGDDPRLALPEGVSVDLGTLEKSVHFHYYPEHPEAIPLSIETATPVKAGRPHAAYYLKVTQTDGHLAWTSPIYLES